jgi:hypothetical protein
MVFDLCTIKVNLQKIISMFSMELFCKKHGKHGIWIIIIMYVVKLVIIERFVGKWRVGSKWI